MITNFWELLNKNYFKEKKLQLNFQTICGKLWVFFLLKRYICSTKDQWDISLQGLIGDNSLVLLSFYFYGNYEADNVIAQQLCGHQWISEISHRDHCAALYTNALVYLSGRFITRESTHTVELSKCILHHT